MFAVFLLDLDFNRHAMAIPARHIGCIKAGHVAALDDDVFQNFVDCVSDVDVTVCVGRAIVQQKSGSSFACLANRLIDAFFLPLCDPQRLAAWQVSAHRKRGVGQIESLFIVHGAQNKPAHVVHRHAWRQSGLGDQETSLRREDV